MISLRRKLVEELNQRARERERGGGEGGRIIRRTRAARIFISVERWTFIRRRARSAARVLYARRAAVSFIDINLTFAWVLGAYRALLSVGLFSTPLALPPPPSPSEGSREATRGGRHRCTLLGRVVSWKYSSESSATTPARAALAIRVFQFIPPGWRN